MPSGIYKDKSKYVGARKGHFVSEKTKIKIGLANSGKKLNFIPKKAFKKGNIPWNKELRGKYPKKYIEKLSGENSPRWKGGVTSENRKIRKGIEFRLWREAVFARDNWTDQKTGIKGGKLHPHHILNFAQYPELRFAIDNGITLSEKSHREFHKKYGIKNNTREQLEEFLDLRKHFV